MRPILKPSSAILHAQIYGNDISAQREIVKVSNEESALKPETDEAAVPYYRTEPDLKGHSAECPPLNTAMGNGQNSIDGIE